MMPKAPTRLIVALLAVPLAGLLGGCSGGKTERAYEIATGGNIEQGRLVIQSYGCGACHVIPGIRGARGMVGPPLLYFGRRSYVAGQVPNTPANVIAWVMAPQSIEPGTAMPTLGLSEQEARDVTAYLYTLR